MSVMSALSVASVVLTGKGMKYNYVTKFLFTMGIELCLGGIGKLLELNINR